MSYTFHAPHDAFEESVFHHLVRAALARWADLPVKLAVEITASEASGVYNIYVTDGSQSFDFMTHLDRPTVHGTAWVAENGHGDPCVVYRLPAQPGVPDETENETMFAPIILWERVTRPSVSPGAGPTPKEFFGAKEPSA